MSIIDKQKELVRQMQSLKTAQDRMSYLVRRGREHPPLDPSLKTGAHLVEGCMARLWFVPEFARGRCYFKIDSDSAVIKGIATVLCELYSGGTPEEIIATSPKFLEEFSITQHLTPNRRNSLAAIGKSIEGFARRHSEKS